MYIHICMYDCMYTYVYAYTCRDFAADTLFRRHRYSRAQVKRDISRTAPRWSAGWSPARTDSFSMYSDLGTRLMCPRANYVYTPWGKYFCALQAQRFDTIESVCDTL